MGQHPKKTPEEDERRTTEPCYPRGSEKQNLKNGVVNRIKSIKYVFSSEYLISLGFPELGKIK